MPRDLVGNKGENENEHKEYLRLHYYHWGWALANARVLSRFLTTTETGALEAMVDVVTDYLPTTDEFENFLLAYRLIGFAENSSPVLAGYLVQAAKMLQPLSFVIPGESDSRTAFGETVAKAWDCRSTLPEGDLAALNGMVRFILETEPSDGDFWAAAKRAWGMAYATNDPQMEAVAQYKAATYAHRSHPQSKDLDIWPCASRWAGFALEEQCTPFLTVGQRQELKGILGFYDSAWLKREQPGLYDYLAASRPRLAVTRPALS